ncbi:MAG TPA: zinc transporter ZupT [Candidatus Coprenecus stercoravium]|uniref:Zinc transporter ZupT n=1 Tax=Candidatus Coprenecus stercoravium TaxID=2840735 RepID=A0A9D2K8U1_9BACT|nr:zinc transporter ZupT [Candidatus Coprenecus stercoravium]
MLTDSHFPIALLLTLLAGLSTGLGGVIVLLTKKFSTKTLSFALGFSAGVMLFISMTELFAEANAGLRTVFGEKTGLLYTVLAFFAGIAIIALIDNLIPSKENPHEYSAAPSSGGTIQDGDSSRLMRLGLFSVIAIAIHNFPEGMATFVSAMENPQTGISIAVAVAIHNIPEGIMVAIPIYYATRKRGKAVGNAFLSGLAEPVGGVAGYLLLSRIFDNSLNGVVLAVVAGIMTYIALDELLPSAEKFGHHHLSIIGVITGMAVMAASLILI